MCTQRVFKGIITEAEVSADNSHAFALCPFGELQGNVIRPPTFIIHVFVHVCVGAHVSVHVCVSSCGTHCMYEYTRLHVCVCVCVLVCAGAWACVLIHVCAGLVHPVCACMCTCLPVSVHGEKITTPSVIFTSSNTICPPLRCDL